MPEFCAPALGTRENKVTITANVPSSANGVLYALGGTAGGLTCYFDEGYLCFEYNLFLLQRTKIRSAKPLSAGQATIEIDTVYEVARPGGPLNISIRVNDEVVASGRVPISVPLLFSANDCLDIGICLGGRVSLDYYDRAPFPFTGTIDLVNVRYTS
jgi:arylsulfatase